MTDDLIGKQIGGYEIQDVIGKGGMATVYKAHQVSMNRTVAVKVLPEQYINDDTYLQRFNQEVAIVAKLEHRNIVPVHDYGEYNGRPYIVMRYMAGGSVDDKLRDGPLEVEHIVNIIEQIAPALDYAHGKNVLHRDLKPSNVLLDDDGGAYLTDFGIARVLGEQAASGITTQGVVGTPSYMSPEQAQGLPLDGRSDIYALGVMLFELATGRRPFEGDTPYGIAVMQVTTPPPSPRTYNPALSFAIEEVIYKTLRKKREERFPNAVAVAESLKRAVNKPVMSMHDTQPGFQRPQPPPASPIQDVAPPAYNVPPVAPPITPNPSASGYGMPYPVRKRRSRPSNLWMSALVGGVLGCGVLAVLIVIAIVIFSNMNRSGQVSPTAASTSVDGSGEDRNLVIPTLDPTSAAGRSTLIPQDTGDSPTLPVGERSAVTWSSAVRSTASALVYFSVRNDNFDIYRIDLNTGIESRLTTHVTVDSYPNVSPDGRQIVFQSNRDGDFEIFVMDIEGSNVRQLTENTVWDRLPAWSPDGSTIIFSSDIRNDGRFDLYAIQPDGTGLRQLYSDERGVNHARYSPDGRYIVMSVGDTQQGDMLEIGRYELESQTFDLLTSNDFKDRSPSYSPDGTTIVYLTVQNAGQPVSGESAIAVMDADGSNSRILYDGIGLEWGAVFSPNSALIAFTTVAASTGREEVFVIGADGTNIQQITTEGGLGASWVP